MRLRELRRVTAVVISVILVCCLFISASMGSDGESLMLVYRDGFDDYVVKEYTGSDGPGVWYQEIDLSPEGSYKIVSSGGKTYYELRRTGSAACTKAILYYFLPMPFLGPLYLGPNNYTFSATMKLDGTEGGLIFRVQPVKAGDAYYFRKYYYAAVNLFADKLVLYYMEADP
ncbi:MAG: hypothetical protein J7K49_01495, partial [Thaumarchaeota archaeon]|nr:hypothetical protein [Nitrososphaerota archaeon]